MGTKKSVSCVGGLLCLLILILDGRTALLGAQQGLELCAKTVVPSLFPFFFISAMINNTLSGSSLGFLEPVRKICSIPRGAEGILLTGFLGGYPVGAQSVGTAYADRKLHRQDAVHLLSFCSNSGPAFLFGMISGLFESLTAVFQLWGIHVFSAILVGIIHPGGPCRNVSHGKTGDSAGISGIMKTAVGIMASVCGWVILFRVVIVFLNRWILYALPETVRILLIGMLELTNGCCELSLIEHPELRYVLCSGFLAFGGICVAMQTASVISDLPLKDYLAGKLLQTLFSLLLSSAVVLHTGTPVFLFLSLFSVLIGKKQKRSGNPMTVGV